MAHLQCFVDIQYSQKNESTQNMWMRCTIYTKGNLHLVLGVDFPAKVRTKVENPVLWPTWPICSVLWTYSTDKKVNHPKMYGWGALYIPKGTNSWYFVLMIQLRCAQKVENPVLRPKRPILWLMLPYNFITSIET